MGQGCGEGVVAAERGERILASTHPSLHHIPFAAHYVYEYPPPHPMNLISTSRARSSEATVSQDKRLVLLTGRQAAQMRSWVGCRGGGLQRGLKQWRGSKRSI